MTPQDTDDGMLQTLERLQTLTPDPARAARVRARCRARLARRQRRDRSTPTAGFGRRVLAPVVVLGLCAVYVASLVGNALRLRGLF